MAESTEELEPLFDYSRVQPPNFVSIDDDSPPTLSPKRMKISDSVVEKVEKNGKVIQVVDCQEKDCKEKEEEDWLPPPPKVSTDAQKRGEDSTIKELRLKKQELLSFTQLAEDMLRAVEESAKKKHNTLLQSSLDNVADQQSNPPCERAKIIIAVQDKDGLKQFRMYMDDKFERLFKLYADKVKLDLQSLVFCFDGDKISPMESPDGLGMEDNDIIEVHIKSS